MRTLTWETIAREDIAFVKIDAAAHNWPCGSSTTYVGSGREENMLFYALEGCRDYRIGEKHVEVHKDDLVLMPAGSCYESRVVSEGGASGVCLKFSLMDEQGEFCCLGEEAVRLGSAGSLKPLVEAVLKQSLQYGSRLRVKALMLELLIALCQSPLSPQPEELRPAIRAMEAHLDAPFAVEEAAQRCHMSVSSFARRFREAMGEPPAAYHRHIRLQKGRELLQSGLYTVEAAGQAVGFYDTAHFCRAYAAYFGEPAGKARGG